jgi:hypothetical protein
MRLRTNRHVSVNRVGAADLTQVLHEYRKPAIWRNGPLCFPQNDFILSENRGNFSMYCFVHTQRAALVYVRQSSLSQVEHNRESTARQYAFADRACQLGWARDQVVIIDEDLRASQQPCSALAPSFLTRRLPQGEVSLLSIGAMGALRLPRPIPPASFPLPLVQAAFRLLEASGLPCSQMSLLCICPAHRPRQNLHGRPAGFRRRVSVPALSFVERVHISILSHFTVSVLSPVFRRLGLLQCPFRGSITRPLHSLSTLHAAVSCRLARLASGWWPTLTEWDWVPTRAFRRVS